MDEPLEIDGDDADETAEAVTRKVFGKPFQKGQSGNPAGRPKGQSVSALWREWLEEPFNERYTRAEALFLKLYQRAINKDDVKAMEILLNRAYGKPKSNVQVEIDGEIEHKGTIIHDHSASLLQLRDRLERIREGERAKLLEGRAAALIVEAQVVDRRTTAESGNVQPGSDPSAQ